MIRILIADDHPIVRTGLRRLLADHEDIAVAAEAGTGDEVFAVLAKQPLDVVLLDVAMPGKGFLEVLQELRDRHPRVRTLVLSAHGEEEYAVRSLRAGAAGYVTKQRTAEELVQAIRQAHRGGRYVSQALAERLALGLADEGEPLAHEGLSDREFQVLQLLGRGKSVKQIAAALKLSPKTVSTYRTRILEKLSLKTTADLIRYAVKHKLAE